MDERRRRQAAGRTDRTQSAREIDNNGQERALRRRGWHTAGRVIGTILLVMVLTMAIFAGIFAGVVTTLCSVLVMSRLFHLSHEEYVTLLPKSITTAIGMGVSEELGGYVTLTVAMIIITGIFGNVTAVAVCRLFHITDPIAKGVSIGSAAHALGTAKAIELGEVEGAMSGLSIVVAGLLTVAGASVFANFM